MADPKFETKTVKIDTRSKRGAKQLAALVGEGWEVVSQSRKGLLEWGDKSKDMIVLRRSK